MRRRSISNWMYSFNYGRPIASRPARTAARHFRTIVGLLVLLVLVLHLAYLVLLADNRPPPLIGLLIIAMALYAIYVLIRKRIAVMWEKQYYTPRVQWFRAQGGIISTTILLFAYAWYRQPDQLWPLFILPVMIVSEHNSTRLLQIVLIQVMALACGAAWLESRMPLPAFVQSEYMLYGLARSAILALLGFLLHYTMRNLDARDERIDQLRNLLLRLAHHLDHDSTHLTPQQNARAIRRQSLSALAEMVNAQHVSVWVPDKASGTLKLISSIGFEATLSLGAETGDRVQDTQQQMLPFEVLRQGKALCVARAVSHSKTIADALVDCIPMCSGAAVEIGVPLQVFQLHRAASRGVLVLDFASSLNRVELDRVYRTAVDLAELISPIFYYVSLTEELLALSELGRSVSRSLEQMPVIDALLTVITNTLGFDFATVSLVDEEKWVIRTVRGKNVPQAWIDQAVHSLDSSDIQADIVRTGKTEVCAGWDDRFDREIWETYGHADMVRIFVPMQVADQFTGQIKVIGTVEAGYQRADQAQITPEQVDLIEPFVVQAAIAMYKAQLYRQAQQRAEALEHLHTVAQAVQQAVWSLPRLMKEIAASALNVLHADIVLLYGYDAEAHRIEFLEKAGEVWGSKQLSLRLNEDNILDWIIAHHHPFYTSDAQNAPELIGYGSDQTDGRCRTFTQRQEIQAFAGIPLLAGERLNGIMCVNYRQAQRFSDENKHLIELFAQMAGVALENARLKELDKALALQHERDALSRELHDASVQDLYGISLHIRAWLQQPDLDAGAVGRLTQILGLSEDVNARIGALVQQLNQPQPNPEINFCVYINQESERIGRVFGIDIDCRQDSAELPKVASAANKALIHVARESLTNAVRHANPRHIWLHTWLDREKQEVCLQVRDDGIGFDPSKVQTMHHGLHHMQTFAAEACGRLHIESQHGGGTTILVSVPAQSITHSA